MFEGELQISEQGLPPGLGHPARDFWLRIAVRSLSSACAFQYPQSSSTNTEVYGIRMLVLIKSTRKTSLIRSSSGDDLFVQQGPNFISAQKIAELFPVGSDTWCILLQDERQFCVGVDCWFEVIAFMKNLELLNECSCLLFVRHNRFDTVPRLRRIG